VASITCYDEGVKWKWPRWSWRSTGPGQPAEEAAVNNSTAPEPHPPTGEQDHPHACLDGYVYLGYTAVDEETGEEVERVEALPCRRCAEAGSV
jgi:hypothetical protein